MTSRHTVRHTLGAFTVAGAAALALVAACSSQSDSSADAGDGGDAPVGVYETYYASGDLQNVGDIESVDFVDATHYSLERTTGSEDQWLEAGTYVLDIANATLALTDSDTGDTETLPFTAGDVSPGGSVTFQGDVFHLLGGGGLTGSGGSLTSGTPSTLTVNPLCGFSSKMSTFKSTQPACKPGTSLTPSGAAVFLTQNGACVPAVFESFNAGGTSEKVFATIKTVADATTTASYKPHLPSGFPPNNVPTCFIDMTNVVDGVTGATLGKNVMVSEHYSLSDLTQSGTTPDRFVILDNQAVRYLEAFDTKYGKAAVMSGFRGPQHQTDTCNSFCGAISCCGTPPNAYPQKGNCLVTCAKTSRHMFGKAFDIGSQYLKQPYINGACAVGFTFVYDEKAGGAHLHIDTSQPVGTCLKQGV